MTARPKRRQNPVPLPSFEGGGKAGILGGHNSVISVYTKNPGLSLKFADFYASESIQESALAKYSLELHDRTPDKVDLEGMWKDAAVTGSPWQWVDGNHGFATFTHLTGYSSNYYTYSLSKVSALDFFNQFDKHNRLEGPAAMRYRKLVLEPGGSKSANDLVKDFLGRPQNYEAFRNWVNAEFETAQK